MINKNIFEKEGLQNTANALTDKSIYDWDFFGIMLATLQANLNDLEIWSTYNDDLGLEEIDKMQEALEKLKDEKQETEDMIKSRLDI